MKKIIIKSLILWWLLTAITYADDIVITKPEWYTGTGPDKIVIQDRNLWATSNDINVEDSYGYKFQRGNNDWFLDSENLVPSTVGLIRDESYVHKWWENRSFINGEYFDRDIWADTSHHDNLWGGENDSVINNRWLDDIEKTQTNRQWPCPYGYHVPSAGEWSKLFEYRCLNNSDKCYLSNMIYNKNLYSNSNDIFIGKNFQIDLKIPFAGVRGWSSAVLNYMANNVWSSSPDDFLHVGFSRTFSMYSSDVNAGGISVNRASAIPVRCFKNYDEHQETLTRREKIWNRLFG